MYPYWVCIQHFHVSLRHEFLSFICEDEGQELHAMIMQGSFLGHLELLNGGAAVLAMSHACTWYSFENHRKQSTHFIFFL